MLRLHSPIMKKELQKNMYDCANSIEDLEEYNTHCATLHIISEYLLINEMSKYAE